MILVLRTDATQPQIDHVIERVEELGFEPRVITGAFRTIVALIGDDNAPGVEKLDAIPGVEHVHRILKPFKLASREFHRADTVVHVGKVQDRRRAPGDDRRARAPSRAARASTASPLT